MKHTLTLIDLGVASKKTQGTTGGQFSDAALGCAAERLPQRRTPARRRSMHGAPGAVHPYSAVTLVRTGRMSARGGEL